MHSCNRVHAFSFYSKKQRPHQRSRIETTCQERTNIMIIILKKQAEEAKINALKKEMEEQAESISKLMKKALKNDKITVKVEKLKNKKISSMITLSEESRRMQDMMKMYFMPGMDMSAFGGEGETLILNASHPLVQYITEHQDGENAEMICEQLYDLAKLQHAPLSADAMTKFVARSNDIMMLLTK